ncbi:gap junction alpha-3 protein [Lepisosteus oculatus]|uniref:gap junction alpha-3 protein n=1 Tax=Lepisosteus oculatus TaxID=7918 RepID=UPI003715B37A
MAAIVTGLIPILRTAVEASTDYKGRTLWFGFLSIRLVVLFVAQLPWSKLDTDFSCNTTGPDLCQRACFNQHFHRPTVMAWNFCYVLLILSVLLMELFASQLRKSAVKKAALSESEAQAGLIDAEEQNGPKRKVIIDFHRHKASLLFYLLCVTLRMSIEISFLGILVFWNLPTLDETPILCRTELCPGTYVCVVRAAAEKRMSIYALGSISAVVVLTSALFFLYSLTHYLILGRTRPAGDTVPGVSMQSCA